MATQIANEKDILSTIKESFPVLKMTCASCAMHVEKALKKAEGVQSAEVNFATETAKVVYDQSTTNPEKLRETVQSAGYDLLLTKGKGIEESSDHIHHDHVIKLKQKAIWAAILSVPLVGIGMFWMNMPYANVIMWILATPVVVWLGRDFFINAWKQARNGNANMDTLVALSTGVAYLLSVFNTLFPEVWTSRGLDAHVYFETAAVVITFILLGKLLEDNAKGNTAIALKKLMGLQPRTVMVLDNTGNKVETPISELAKGNLILARPGEKIAVDGVVISGDSFVDESMLSGESMPVQKQTNARVYAGTLNQSGSLQYKAEKIGEETMLSQIIQMVKDAQGSKAPVQKLVDKIAAVFVPAVILIAILAFFAWWGLGGENGLSQGIMAFVTVLVIACPCALGLATPTAIMVGVGKGAEAGILIKDAESLEQARRVNALVLDKTGTITEGKPTLTNISWKEEKDVLRSILKSLETQSEHPVAKAISVYFESSNSVEITDFKNLTGKGVQGKYEGQLYLSGNLKLMKDHAIVLPGTLKEQAQKWEAEAKTVIWFSDTSSAFAVMAVSDQIKASSGSAIQKLQEHGIEVIMLTGDNQASAKAVAEQTGIKTFKSDLLPQDKSDFVKHLQAQGKVVAMVGDGINDSTALAQADLSIAMGKGSDIAMDVAGMTIISSDLTKIPQAISLSGFTVNTIRQNLFWAFIYNVIGIPLAAGVLYAVNGFMLNPMIAGAAMALSSVSVVGNSLRLKWKKL